MIVLYKIRNTSASGIIREVGGDTVRRFKRSPCETYRVLVVDQVPLGMWGLRRPGYFSGDAYMGFDCAFPNAPSKAASLVAASATSREARLVAECLHRRRLITIATTALSHHPDAMKYRHWWRKMHATEQPNGVHKILYQAEYANVPLQAIYEAWLTRGGSAVPARPDLGEGTVGFCSLRSILRGQD